VNIPFVSLKSQHETCRDEIMQKIRHVLQGGSFILSNEVVEFETAYAYYCETNYCIGVGNGTDALKICLRALDIGKGDEVIIPANTFISTALAVIDVGAIPVLVEPDQETLLLSSKHICDAITSKTKAIIPVHLYGTPCPMDEIVTLAKGRDLWIVEDNAQAQGARYRGRPTGSMGHINATSFYPSKNLGAMGDAGAITTQNRDLAIKTGLLRNLGASSKYTYETLGYNSRLDALQAAILSVKLAYLNKWNQERKRIAQLYKNHLSSCTEIIMPTLPDGSESVYHLFVVKAKKRNELQTYLLKHGIQTLVHYPNPLHLEPCLGLVYSRGQFPTAEQLSERILSLPLFIGMKDEEIDYVCEKIIQFYDKSHGKH